MLESAKIKLSVPFNAAAIATLKDLRESRSFSLLTGDIKGLLLCE